MADAASFIAVVMLGFGRLAASRDIQQRSSGRARTKVALTFLRIIAPLARRRKDVGTSTEVRRILVVELWNIGDVVLLMPFLAQLRARFPNARISLLGRPVAEDVLAGTGLIDELISTDLAIAAEGLAGLSHVSLGLWSAVRELRAREFDLAFSARLHLREHLLLALSGARRTIGYHFPNENGVLTDPVRPTDLSAQKIEYWLRLLEPFGGASTVVAPRLAVTDVERLSAKGRLLSLGISGEDLLIGVHPGASLEQKRWPLEGFREVSAALATQRGVRVLIFEEPDGYGSELAELRGVIALRVTLRELVALIARCDLLICNDSGPMHIAGALGVPTVAMFGAGIDQWFAPLGEGHEILQPEADAGHRDVTSDGIRSPKGIRPSQVLDAVGRAVHRLRERRTLSSV